MNSEEEEMKKTFSDISKSIDRLIGILSMKNITADS